MIRAAVAYGIYRWLISPLVLMLLHVFFPFLPAKLRQVVIDRKPQKFPPLLSAPIWIHASSGEIEYAKSVIRSLKAHYPELPILVTYFSPSAKKLLQNFPGVDLALPLPWDRPEKINAFLTQYRPRAGLFSRTDVWPTAVTEARRRGIPLLLFAATLSSDSSHLKFFRASLARWSFARLNQIFCVSIEDEKNFHLIDPHLPVTIAGDTRFDQVFFRLQTDQTLPARLAPQKQYFVFIAGSTWPEDEAILLPEFKALLENSVRIILAPHEIGAEHLTQIESTLGQLGISSQRFSQATEWSKNSVLLIDEIGRLAELYRWGNLAFVGGSFKSKVHSVMEPLAAGLPVLVGPHHLNNREALQMSQISLSNRTTAVCEIHSSSEFRKTVLFWRDQSREIRTEIQNLTKKKTGASRFVIEWVQTELGLPKTAPAKNLDTSSY